MNLISLPIRFDASNGDVGTQCGDNPCMQRGQTNVRALGEEEGKEELEELHIYPEEVKKKKKD